MKVLVADDHPPNRKMMMVLINALGHDVDLATNGREACNMAERTAYDMILMDIHMPVMDGLDAVACIRKLPGATPRLVIVTADATEESRVKALAVGADTVHTKPVDVGKLKALLDSPAS